MPWRWKAAVATMVVVAAVAWAHTLLRGDSWAYVWFWAFFQYQLVVLLVAPLVAGAAAWEAVAFRAANGAVVASGRSVAFAGWVVARVVACTAAGLAIGVLPTLVAVWRVRGIQIPPVEALRTIGPAGAQLVAVAATSFVLAVWWPRAVVAPVLAVAWFVGLIVANVVLPDQVARIGGATASLLGLHVPLATQLRQVAVALAVAAVAGGLAWVTSVRGTPMVPRLAALVVPLAALGVLVSSTPQGRDLFERRPVKTTCLGERPTWCLAGPYSTALETLRDRSEPAFREMDAVGAPRPERIVQGDPGAPYVEEILFDDPVYLPYPVVYAWLRPGCWPSADSQLLGDLTFWVHYLEDRQAGRRPRAEGNEATFLRIIAEKIVACEGR